MVVTALSRVRFKFYLQVILIAKTYSSRIKCDRSIANENTLVILMHLSNSDFVTRGRKIKTALTVAASTFLKEVILVGHPNSNIPVCV